MLSENKQRASEPKAQNNFSVCLHGVRINILTLISMDGWMDNGVKNTEDECSICNSKLADSSLHKHSKNSF